MKINSLYLYNFRNYNEATFDFDPNINCVLGPNGSGKTNLLDAIYFLCLSKSFTHKLDHLNIQHEQETFLVEGSFEKATQNEQITISQQKGQRKSLLHDKKLYEKVGDHIGKYPVVLITPDDTEIIKDGPETRRKLFDGILAQCQPGYLGTLMNYKKKVDERNKLLKDFAERNYIDKDLLEVYDEVILPAGKKILEARVNFLNEFLPIFKKHYAILTNNNENVNISYDAKVDALSFEKKYLQNLKTDLKAQRTLVGPHRDDFFFEINAFALKKYGSQGQKKSFILALKIAQFEFLTDLNKFKPILLLDDIFDKLDDSRILHLVEMIDQQTFGQVFITDARPERTQAILKNCKTSVKSIVF